MAETLKAQVAEDHASICFAGLLTQLLEVHHLGALVLNLQPLLLKLSELQFILTADLVLLSMQHLSAQRCSRDRSTLLSDPRVQGTRVLQRCMHEK